ncbi:MAG: Glu/Leu/Phe/Val dehydrogenase [Alphaproteobacteria bacterium]|nr:Glu/Leu/Phe/Val dehydrogenase [Alphaproteobacteria bacterium]
MTVFAAPDYDGHEHVSFGYDPETGLRAVIAIHNTNLGPAVGGCRMWSYTNDQAALSDALRLSRGMTYKSALAGLPFGGGKSVIIGDAKTEKTAQLMQAMGRFVESLGGRYVAAEDIGMKVSDMDEMAKVTKHVTGTSATSGNPSPFTAYGVLRGIEAAVEHRLQRNDGLAGTRVAIQGLGAVGFDLARRLHEKGARLHVADINTEAVAKAVDMFDATPVNAGEIHAADVDVFSPCALGALINDDTIDAVQAKIVAGSANNQLSNDSHGTALAARGILYAPDYVINAGGIIEIAHGPDFGGTHDDAEIYAHLDRIHDTLAEIFQRADVENAPTNRIADTMAEERFQLSV